MVDKKKKKVLIISAKKNYLKAVKFANSFSKKIAVSHANSLEQARQWIGKKGKRYFSLLVVDSSVPEENFDTKAKVLRWDPSSEIHSDMALT